MRIGSLSLLVSWWFVGAAFADPPAPITIKSVVASAGTADAWKVFATAGSWCARAPGDTLTITFAKPTALARVELAHEWTITGVTLAADGTSHVGVPDKAEAGMDKGQRTTPVAIGGAPVTSLVVTVTGTGCIERIALPAVAVYGADASTLWDDVAAVKKALASCQPRALGAAFVFPFSVGWYTMTTDGMKEHAAKLTAAAKLQTACKQNKYLRQYRDALSAETAVVHSASATELELETGGAGWTLESVDGHWKPVSVMMGG